MRKLTRNVWIESRFGGLTIGALASDSEILLVDCPLRTEDVREWLGQLSTLGSPRYLALIDGFPDRVLGARVVDLPILAQDRTLEAVLGMSDTFKGNVHPIGAEADRLKRITGVQKAVPTIIFSRSMTLHLGGRAIRFLHRPGPHPGAMWVLDEEEGLLFIGEAVAIEEPPYLGTADIERWIDLLDDLREGGFVSQRMVCARGGLVSRENVNAMARFLRKVQNRVKKLQQEDDPEEIAARFAEELLEDFPVAASRREMAVTRLRVGLVDLVQAGESGGR